MTYFLVTSCVRLHDYWNCTSELNPRSKGKLPAVLDRAPAVLDKAPGVWGKAPAVLDKAPDVLGKAPDALGKPPDVLVRAWTVRWGLVYCHIMTLTLLVRALTVWVWAREGCWHVPGG
jgi:hypothetical protein